MSVSIVQYFGEQTNKCGYCSGTNCSKSHGMHAYRLACEDYQDLIDRGWRRCGNYCYKPQNDKTCCPCYTIKCDALEFKLSKSNKRILRRMNKFLRDGKREPNEQQHTPGQPKNGDGDDVDVSGSANESQPQLPDKKPSVLNVEHVENLVQAHVEQIKTSNTIQVSGDPSASLLANNKIKAFAPNLNPPRKKAKQMRIERRQAKLGVPHEQPQPQSKIQEKTLKDFLSAPKETDKHQLKIALVPASDTQRTCTDAVFALYRKYQLVIHNDNPARLSLESMRRYWVKSPLKHKKIEDLPNVGYGSFHQQYWLDTKLIAVGVIDILPGSVSSVYFFYDPDYSFLSLGTYGSLREIDLVQTLAERVPALKYYYMGFYIHSCPKMRYKGKLSASYLLCPETYVWFPLTDEIRNKLDAKKYQRLNPDATAKDVNEFLNQHLNDVMLLINPQTCISYGRFIQRNDGDVDRDVILEYSKLVGRVCAQRMLYVNMS
ncbi:PREDICTED: arginyl-tRNA--protein transferase 1 isoform X1 [Drosophila arizonae]|uniref:Arginyl-tRNA--protein transferase 1 n=1 Tax=Drosophila arizonae TaxID=7263 RepID=A0ABM1PK38_DROAR|nr:PREDICTED: arginyl-tRNA--protein transferase 1 isoform X1 [Drosophila arizonae]XP_017867575.1 PREDICTED: arginyl-tRNA--protein transferase 1 isoform X1 [Drosophila arizonae]